MRKIVRILVVILIFVANNAVANIFPCIQSQGISFIEFNDDAKDELLKNLNTDDEKYLKFIDLENTFKIEIKERDFYVIKNLEDGNYLAMDKNGLYMV